MVEASSYPRLPATGSTIAFFQLSRSALFHARKKQGAVAVWANRVTPELQQKACAMRVPLLLVEDGFIRSIGLGSDLLPPCSIIMDNQGTYVTPSRPSHLETLLNEKAIPPALQARAGRRVILVPGQVAGDLSVIRGGGAIQDNLSLLREVRRRNPDAAPAVCLIM